MKITDLSDASQSGTKVAQLRSPCRPDIRVKDVDLFQAARLAILDGLAFPPLLPATQDHREFLTISSLAARFLNPISGSR